MASGERDHRGHIPCRTPMTGTSWPITTPATSLQDMTLKSLRSVSQVTDRRVFETTTAEVVQLIPTGRISAVSRESSETL